MHVEPEDEIGASHHLHVFHDFAIAGVGVDFLFTPVAEWMRASRPDRETVLAGQCNEIAADFGNLGLGFFDVLAYASTDLNHRLMHFGLYSFPKDRLTFFADF